MVKILEGSCGLIIVNNHILVNSVILVVNKNGALHFERDEHLAKKSYNYVAEIMKLLSRLRNITLQNL